MDVVGHTGQLSVFGGCSGLLFSCISWSAGKKIIINIVVAFSVNIAKNLVLPKDQENTRDFI